MRHLLPNGVHAKLSFHLTRRPTTTTTTTTTTTRSPLRGRQQRNNSSEPPKDSSSEPANDSAPSKSSQMPSNSPTSPPPPPPPGSVASSAGASTPPVAAGAASSRSISQIIQAGPVGRAGRSYSRAQDRRPYLTQLCSSIVVYLCGDLSAQFLFPSEAKKSAEDKDAESGQDEEEEEQEEAGEYDPGRTLRHLTVGIGSSIPSYNWFMFLHHNFNFASRFLSVLTKVAIQQLVFTPVFNAYFFSVHSLLSGSSLPETLERLKLTVPVAFVNSAKLWPAVTAFSFMYVPPQFRSVFSGCIAIGWQTYLSWLNQKAAREVEVAELEEQGQGQSNSAGSGLRAAGVAAPA